MAQSRAVHIISTGGTILHRGKEVSLENPQSTETLTADLDPQVEASVSHLGPFRGADHTLETILEVRDKIRESRSRGGCVVLTGTDGMEEFAFALDLTLEPRTPVVITGAMRPVGVPGEDARRNVQAAVRTVLAVTEPQHLGVLVVMNDTIHAARYVKKAHSTNVAGIRSSVGPVGEVPGDRVILHFAALPEIERYPEVRRGQVAALNILLWTATLQPSFPYEALEACDGVVLEGMGTGSLPRSVAEALGNEWTSRLPVVLVSRCEHGRSYDDTLYRNSRAKYEDMGYRLRGFEDLDGPRARMKLALMVASGRLEQEALSKERSV